MSKVRIGLQIEETSPLVRKLIGSGLGESKWDGDDPDDIVKVTYTEYASNIQEIYPDTYYNIPTITTAKQGDTLLSDDGRFFVYDESGNRWFLWYRFDIASAVITNNTLTGDGTSETPLSVNPTTVALKGEINPALKGVDNGDGTYTFTTIDGSTSFTINAGLSDNIYNTDGVLTGHRMVDLDGKGLTFSGNQAGGEAFLRISSFGDGTFTVNTAGTPLIGVAFRALFARELKLYTGQDLTILTPTTDYYALKLVSTSGKVEYHPITADDIDDSTSTNKFVNQSLVNLISSALQPGDLATVATTGNYSDLTGAPAIPDSLDDLSGDSDDITEGTAHLFMTTTERNKLSGIASGAEVNVNADWNAVSGDAQILNKPTLGTAAYADTGDFATAMQGALADTAVQPGDLATVATTGAYSDLTGTPAIPNSLDDLSGDSDDISEGTTNLFMTSLERSKLTGIASGAEVNVNADWNAVSGDAQILNKPTLGTAAAANTGDFATAAQGSLADTAVQPGDLATVATSGAYSDLSGTPTIPDDSTDLTDSADLIRNNTDTFSSKITNIVSLTQIQFDGITPDSNTMYLIIE